jgi:hypothetical protein
MVLVQTSLLGQIEPILEAVAISHPALPFSRMTGFHEPDEEPSGPRADADKRDWFVAGIFGIRGKGIHK